MAFPKDLRQRMINLMYLVLMAMLAINIDPAALQGYKTINKGMNASYSAFATKNTGTVETIKAKVAEEGTPEQKQYLSLAEKLNGVSDSMDSDIDELIADIRANSTNAKGDYIADSKDPADKIMIQGNKAADIKAKIQDVVNRYSEIVNESPMTDEDKAATINAFALHSPSDEEAREDPDNVDGYGWEEWTFKGKPSIALEAMLRQMKNDAKATEGQILETFAQKLDANKVVPIEYDVYSLAVIPSSTYVETGQPFTAKINVGQTSTKMKDLVKVYVNGRQVPIDSEGFAVYKETKGIGDHSLSNVYAEIIDPNTQEKTKVSMKDPIKYKVINPSKPSAAVSADAMNVFYIGLDNPVSVSATGMGQVQATCAGCQSFAANGNGGYNAKVGAASAGKKVQVNVSIDGNSVESKEFRVLKVPDPDVKIGNYKPGRAISTSSLAAQKILRADLDNFPYDAPFQVVSFDLGMLKGNRTPFTASSTGPRITPQMSNAFQRAGPGWLVVFRNIKVKGPDGQVRDVGSITYVTK